MSMISKQQVLIVGAAALLAAAAMVAWHVRASTADCEQYADPIAKQECWDKLLRTETRDEGVAPAFETLTRLYKEDPAFAADCHNFTHSIGEEAYGIYSAKHALALSPLTSLCGYGFYHGFLEQLLYTTGNLQEARDFCDYAGSALAGERSVGAAYACYHGWGHGITDGSNPAAWGDPKAMTDPSLKLCTQLATTQFELSRCATGVFNALEILSQDPKYKLDALAKDPFAFCQGELPIYREPCYTNMIPAVLRLANNDFSKAAEYVIANIPLPHEATSIPDDGNDTESTVILGLFNEFIRVHLNDPSYDVGQGVLLCRTLPSDARLPCIQGLSGGHMKYGEPQQEYVKAFAFCKSELLAPDERDACFGYILPRLAIWYAPAKVKQLCAVAGEPYAGRYCKSS